MLQLNVPGLAFSDVTVGCVWCYVSLCSKVRGNSLLLVKRRTKLEVQPSHRWANKSSWSQWVAWILGWKEHTFIPVFTCFSGSCLDSFKLCFVFCADLPASYKVNTGATHVLAPTSHELFPLSHSPAPPFPCAQQKHLSSRLSKHALGICQNFIGESQVAPGGRSENILKAALPKGP